MMMRFLPATDGSWVSVDPFTARVTRIDVARDARGRVQSLAMGAGEPRGRRENAALSTSPRRRPAERPGDYRLKQP